MIFTNLYIEQAAHWPKHGKHILAQHDDNSMIICQTYRSAGGQFEVKHGYFGRDFCYSRMSWSKTDILWMVCRSGWGTKPGQEVTLVIHLRRSFFDNLLVHTVESSFVGSQFTTTDEREAEISHLFSVMDKNAGEKAKIVV